MATAIQIPCVVRNYDPTSDTASVEITGTGNIGEWIDGVKILTPINRASLASGVGGVLSAPDAHRLCEAQLIHINTAPPVQSSGSGTQSNQTGRVQVPTGAGGTGGPQVVGYNSAFATAPSVSVSADNGATVVINSVGLTTFSISITAGGQINGVTSVSWNAVGH